MRCRFTKDFNEVRDAGSKSGGGRAPGDVNDTTSSIAESMFVEKTVSMALSRPCMCPLSVMPSDTSREHRAHAVFRPFFSDILAYHVQQVRQIPGLLG